MSKFLKFIQRYCNSLDITLGRELLHVASQKKIYILLLKGLWSPFLSFTSKVPWPWIEESLHDSDFGLGVCLSFLDLSCLLKHVPVFNSVISTGTCETSSNYQSFISPPAAYKDLTWNHGVDPNLLLVLLQDCTSICSLKKPLLFHACLEV